MESKKRFKVKFPDNDAYTAAMSMELASSTIRVRSDKRHFVSVELPNAQRGFSSAETKFDANLSAFERYFGAKVVEDFQFSMEKPSEIFDISRFLPDSPIYPSLDDVLSLIKAKDAWPVSTGAGAAIAIVDTGVDGTRPEFPLSKRLGGWQPDGDNAWTDWLGHGTMCACIATSTDTYGGVFRGVAPDAHLISCKTYFYDSELANIYDYLTGLSASGLKIVASNSFGIKTGSPPPIPSDSDFLRALDDAIMAGIVVVFSSGNYHELTGGTANDCTPTSIWLHKCRSDILSVATCKLDGSVWNYSSRGPGQFFGQANTNRKPDITAPTPANGRILYGNDITVLPEGWGTSGACPQVAGLAALMLTKTPNLTREELFSAIRNSASPLTAGLDCIGAGLINCKAALDAI
jgi:serine protease AprX